MSLRGSFQPKKSAAAAPPAAAAPTTAGKSANTKLVPAAAAQAPLVVRRAVLEDGDALNALYNSSSLLQRENITRSFGHHAIKTLIESCVVSLVVESAGQLVGFAAFGDEAPHYLMRVVSDNAAAENMARQVGQLTLSSGERVRSDWVQFLQSNYNATDAAPLLTYFNTVWLRYLIISENIPSPSSVSDRLFHSLFSTLTQIDQVLASIPLAVDPFSPLSDLFDELHISSETADRASASTISDLNTVRIFACPRSWFLPNLVMRRARIEDNDDLVPICNNQSEILTAIYGEFFLATLIQSQNDHQHVLVAEVDHRAVGLMGITDQVDVKLLQSCFELDPYEQLRKQKSDAQLAEENGPPTPISRMNNIFLTITRNPAPLSVAEREKQALASAVASKRGSLISKRASFGAGGLAALAGLLKPEAAAASSPPISSNTLSVPTNVDSPLGPSITSPTNAGSSSATAPPAEPLTSFPIQWLLNYIETFRPDPVAISNAMKAKEDRENAAAQLSSDEEGEAARAKLFDRTEAEEEQEEAILMNVAIVLTRFQNALANVSTLDNQAFNDTVVAVLGELEDATTGGLIRFLELATRVPADMPVRPPPIELDASVDDGTAQDNVFCITLFCLDEKYESRSIDMIKSAFDLYPDRNYCVLTLPHTSPPSSINLLQYFSFINPTSKNTFSHALYLLHRDTIATMNSLAVQNFSLRYTPSDNSGKSATATGAANSALIAAEEANTEKLLGEVEPLIAHLPNFDQLKVELRASVKQALQVKANQGSDSTKLKHISTAGLSGGALLAKRKEIQVQLLESKTSPTETLLITCLGSVVGLVLFNRLSSEEVSLLRADFAVEDFISVEDLPAVEIPKSNMPSINPNDPNAQLPQPLEDVTASIHLNILTFIINPLWNNQVAFICKEMLRLKNAHVLYYQVWSKRTQFGKAAPSALDNLSPQCSLNAAFRFSNGFIVPQLIDTFIQVRPRRRPAVLARQEELTVIGASREEKTALTGTAFTAPSAQSLPCALHILSRRLISQPKSVINARLVIVGSSTTALSFLETLLLIPDKQYSSITLLSKDGLTSGTSGNGDACANSRHFLPWSLSFNEAWLDRLNFGSRIKIVKGTMIDLRSASKTLLLADGTTLPYDVLVLTPGLQNQLPLSLIRLVQGQALSEELARKEENRIRREEALRDARRKKKAQEQGLEDTSTLDAEALARLDEELEREARAKESRGDDSDGSGEGSDDDDDDASSVASFDSKGRPTRRKKGKTRKAPTGKGHEDWKRWIGWSSSGLESWEDDFGSLLAKQRALAEGTLDPSRALAANAAAREWAATEEGAADKFDPSKLDLTPYGISGIYSVSSEEHVAFLLDAFHKDKENHQNGGWLVNGASLDALTSIQGLMELGVNAKNITWIHPLIHTTPSAEHAGKSTGAAPTVSSISFLNLPGSATEDDPLVLSRVMASLSALGVTIMPGKVIKAVKQEEGKVYGVVLGNVERPKGSDDKQAAPADDTPIEVSVVGLIGCGELDVDPYVFRSVHGNSLVYDGRLVLDHSFQTTIPSIYAAGPLSKFSRAYGSQVLQLERYNSVEVGQKLCAAVMRTALDVHQVNAEAAKLKSPKKKQSSLPPATQLPPLGIQPKVTHAILPGHLLYFHAHIPTHRKIVQPKVLITEHENRMCRFVFNDYNILHAITIVTAPKTAVNPNKFQLPDKQFLARNTALANNLVQLIGMPASYMNRILYRYQQKQIVDLADFLSEPWSLALYHESFSHLRAFLHYFMLENRLEIVAILDRIIQMFTSTIDNAKSEEEKAAEDGEVVATNDTGSSSLSVDPFLVSQLTSLLPASIKEVVQRALLRFLRQHENHLPRTYTAPKPFYAGPQAKPKNV